MGLLDQAVGTLVGVLATRQPAVQVQVFQPDELLVLLRSLNSLIGASEPQGDVDRIEQVWILSRADRMEGDQLDILRRIALNYPELRVRLVFFSVSLLAPATSHGVHQAQIPVPLRTTPDLAGEDAALTPRRKHLGPWALLAAAIAAGGSGLWWAGHRAADPSASHPEPAAVSANESAASTPAAQEPPRTDSSPVAASEPASQPMPNGAPEPAPAAMSASRRWLLSLPTNSLVVVHADMPSLREAESFRAAGQPLLANARILQTVAQPERPERYLVVTAPFRSPERAQGYMQRLQWKPQARSVSRDELLSQVPR